jgi:hypothetical protein
MRPAPAAGRSRACDGGGEAPRQQLRERSLAAHAAAEGAVVILSSAHLPDQAHHVRGTVGIMQFQPFAPDLLEFVRQA